MELPPKDTFKDAALIAFLKRLTPAERLRLNDRTVRAALKLREAVRRAQSR